MMKMYHSYSDAGSTAAYWGEVLGEAEAEQMLAFCPIDPLRTLWQEHTHPGDLVLEGGCGLGQYVQYYDLLGRRMIGLDFALTLLTQVRQRLPSARLCAGDVGRLPFRDGCLDAYYSGGVVEHFEQGPRPALREARRVLKAGGRFLVSVPYLSPLRRLTGLVMKDRRRVHHFEEEDAPDNLRFFQYAFGVGEFRRLLRESGFHVVLAKPTAFLYGLYEVPGVEGLVRRLRPKLRAHSVSKGPPAGPPTHTSGPLRTSLGKRLAASEDTSVAILGPLWGACGWLFANMILFVAVAEDR